MNLIGVCVEDNFVQIDNKSLYICEDNTEEYAGTCLPLD